MIPYSACDGPCALWRHRCPDSVRSINCKYLNLFLARQLHADADEDACNLMAEAWVMLLAVCSAVCSGVLAGPGPLAAAASKNQHVIISLD